MGCNKRLPTLIDPSDSWAEYEYDLVNFQFSSLKFKFFNPRCTC